MVHKCKNQYNLLRVLEYSRLYRVGRQEQSSMGDIESEVITQWAAGDTLCKEVRLQLNSITSTTALGLSQTSWEEGG